MDECASCFELMNGIARILIAVVSGLTVLPLASAGGPEPTAVGPMAGQVSALPAQAGTQAVLRPYYIVPFFPFLWPVPAGHPAATSPQAQPPQSSPYPSYPFVIWLPVQLPATPPAPVGTPLPAPVEPPAGQPVTEPAVATVQPTPPQAPTTEATTSLQEGAGPLTVLEAPHQPAVEPGPLPMQPAPAPAKSVAAEPSPEPVVVKELPPKGGARPGAAPTVRSKPTATRPGTAKPAKKNSANKRKLCWKDGKLDVCK